MTNAHKKLAVFDWNSTLFDDMAATHEGTKASLKFFGLAPLTLEEEQELFTFPLIHFYEKIGVSVDEYLKHAEEVGRLFHDTYNAHKSNCTLADGAEDLLDYLRRENVDMIILSNHNQSTLEHDVARFDITNYFDIISGNADPATIISGTNKLERLQSYMNDNGYTNTNTFIIGDSHEEPELARKLDILGISIAGGLLSPSRLAHYKKDYVIDSLREMPAILNDEWNLALPPKNR